MPGPVTTQRFATLLFTVLFVTALLFPVTELPAQRRGAPRVAPQSRIDTRTYEFKDAKIKKQEYALFVPSDYKKSKKTPLIVALHGLGSNPRQILSTRGFASLADQHGYILAAPFGYNERGWYGMPVPGAAVTGLLSDLGVEPRGRGAVRGRISPSPEDPPNLRELSEKDVFNVLAIVRKDYNIDPDRIYLMGHSMGGGGTLHIGMKYPGDWAALAPFAPAIFSGQAGLEKITRMPVFVVQGDEDNTVPVGSTRRWVEKMKELGMTYQYVEVAGGDHISIVPGNLPKMFDFFDKHPRQASK